ncbi:MAG: 16S rRNA processing protein RimM [Chloroflexi bacterium]|nr:MAG: 16S rRNA processing protein RimM [Chloroflexota bacterium]
MSTSSWRSCPTTERLAVARILGAKGLSGVVRIEPLTDWRDHLEVGARVYLEDEATPRRITTAEWGGRVPAIGLEGIGSRDDAARLAGRYLETEPQALPEGTYYWHQLQGLTVQDPSGARLGVLREVFRAGEAEVYRVELTDGGELLVPAVRDVVHGIDLEAGIMVVDYASEEVR